MSRSADEEWNAQQAPFDHDMSEIQIERLLDLLGSQTRRVLDLGCGAGRVLAPVARAGHELTGVERDPEACEACRAMLDADGLAATLVERDFLGDEGPPPGEFDAVLCLGNTLMTIWDVDLAVDLVRAVRDRLAPGGMFVIDDLPGLHWPEVAEGYWVEGVSEDGASQFIWDRRDAVFSVRSGDAVDPEAWTIEPGDRKYRAWTDGALGLLARAAGLSPPETVADGVLIVMRRL
jgi:SAM-dependent methyltransferase